MNPRRWILAGVAALALAILTLPRVSGTRGALFARGGGQACPPNARPANLSFSLKDIHGKGVNLASLKGKVILLDFWATWCGPCKMEIPGFVELQDKYGKDGLVVIGVAVEDSIESIKPFVAQYKMNYIVVNGSDRNDLQDAYGPMLGIPTTFLIGRDGKVCAKHTGVASKEQFEKEIRSLL
jgi:thiol-disulfide isomerase/thioredoxin